jgi:hypothetical protein
MTEQQSGRIQPPTPIPPTEPGQLPADLPQTSWPRTLGIVSIILGALGTLGGALGASAELILKALQMTVEEKDAVDWDAVGRAVAWLARISLVAAILAAVLLVVGIGLVRRRAWAIRLGNGWAIAQIVVTVLGTAGSYVIQRSIAEAIQQAGTSTRGLPLGTSPGGAAASLVWGCGLPVFMLIWFARREIREEVAAWR